MELIERLKKETADLHEKVEKENLARFIMDHSIDISTYELLLLQNYVAYRDTERAIKKILPNYKAGKYLRILADLEGLGISAEPVVAGDRFECSSKAEALGAAYVVEGSALGGMVLARNISRCEGLSSLTTQHFFNADHQNIQNWKEFKTQLEKENFSETEEEQAIRKARETFEFFGHIFRLDLAELNKNHI